MISHDITHVSESNFFLNDLNELIYKTKTRLTDFKETNLWLSRGNMVGEIKLGVFD